MSGDTRRDDALSGRLPCRGSQERDVGARERRDVAEKVLDTTEKLGERPTTMIARDIGVQLFPQVLNAVVGG